VTVGRDLAAKYLINTRVEVGRDARVSNEITNCQTVIGRHLDAPACTIAGGSLRVAGASHVGQLGSEACPPTELWLGSAPGLESLLAQAGETLRAIQDQCAKAHAKLEEFRRALTRPSSAQAAALTLLETAVATWEGRRTALIGAAREALRTLRANTAADLTVQGHIFAGVRLHLGPFTAEPRADLKGPLRIWVDERGVPQLTDLTSKSTSPLSYIAHLVSEPPAPPIPGLEDHATAGAKAA
jgi:hypothetical protein